MTIRTKLLGAFFLIALLVPLLGGISVNRVQRVAGDVTDLSRDAIPSALLAKDLDALQREQQRAVLAYAAGGLASDRQRYEDLKPQVDQKLSELTGAIRQASKNDVAGDAGLIQQIRDQRVAFDAAAAQLIDARVATEQNLETVRVRAEDMVLELTILRNRFAPTPTSQVDRAQVPAAVRSQVSELLFGTEGMMSIVGFEAALAAGYVVTVNPQLRQRFEDASNTWPTFLKTAKGAGGPDDLPILARVETKFAKEFEPSARALIATADGAAQARASFAQASAAISSRVDDLVAIQTGRLGESHQDARATAGSTKRVMLILTLVAFAMAGALGIWFARTITRPIRELRDVANRISTGDLDNTEIHVRTTDEVGDLAGAFRRMTASVRLLMTSQGGD